MTDHNHDELLEQLAEEYEPELLTLETQDGGELTLEILSQLNYGGEDYLVAAQSDNAYNRPLSSYRYGFARYIHIEGVRMRLPDSAECFSALYEGKALFGAQEEGIDALPNEEKSEAPFAEAEGEEA